METFFFALFGYLIGSIPVAYLLVRKKHGVDLRREGSGNIGARNAFEVTGNKRLGFAVLSLDMLKGIIPLIILDNLGYCEMIPIVAVTIILGHCYPLWLKFHGGRGLATGAAIAMLFSPYILLCWIIVYFASGFFKKQVHLQAFIATLSCIIFELLIMFISGADTFALLSACFSPSVRTEVRATELALHYSMLAILVIIISRHIQPVYELFRKRRS